MANKKKNSGNKMGNLYPTGYIGRKTTKNIVEKPSLTKGKKPIPFKTVGENKKSGFLYQKERTKERAKEIRDKKGDMNLVKKPSQIKKEKKQKRKEKAKKFAKGAVKELKPSKKAKRTRLGRGMKVSSKTAVEGLMGSGTIGW